MLKQAKLPGYLAGIRSPLKLEAWHKWLGCHPDWELANLLQRGITSGFRVGLDAGQSQLQSRKHNLLSAAEHPEEIDSYIQKEVAAGRVVKVSSPEEADRLGIHCSPFGVIPKKNKPNQWRLIVDLSSPEGHSINDGIDSELAKLSYTSVDQAVAQVLKLGRGALMAKMDIKRAYRNVPVHQDDRYLLGMRWRGEVYLDMALPFNLRSAPIIFLTLADMLQWIMAEKGASWLIHYMDDYFTAGQGPPGSPTCKKNTEIMNELCEEVGLPIDHGKDEGPATTIDFLGIQLDSVAMQIQISSGCSGPTWAAGEGEKPAGRGNCCLSLAVWPTLAKLLELADPLSENSLSCPKWQGAQTSSYT